MTQLTQTPADDPRTKIDPHRRVRAARNRLLAAAASVLFMICAPAASTTAHARTAGEYGAHVAYSKAADSDKGNYLVGGHLELMLAPALGVVGAVDYRSSERFRIGVLPGESVRVKSVPVTLSGRLYLPMAPTASPFLEGGAGWYRVVYDYSDAYRQVSGFRDQTVTSFGWHLGGGLKLGLSPSVALTGEARWVFVDPERKLDADVRESIRNLDYNTVTYGVGLGVTF